MVRNLTLKGNRNRRGEAICYVVMWLLIMAFYLLNEMRARSLNGEVPIFEWAFFPKMASSLLPFFVLFLVHNFVLLPKLLLRDRYALYFTLTILLIAVIWYWQREQFIASGRHFGPPPPEGAQAGPQGPEGMTPPKGDQLPPWMRQGVRRHRPLAALPMFLDFTYDLLLVGVNIATALIFKGSRDRLERERLRKANAENQLTYLKAQINPHFYMNMLNNIHGMIDINPEKAQDMVLDMSKLMRYMLYESSKPMVKLSEEIDFVRNYLQIMRQRFPEKKVRIDASFPPDTQTSGICVPPLIYLVYIENAFKHGVSYREDSFVEVKVEVRHGEVVFSCVNSVHPSAEDHEHGIGLENASKRLQLLYGESYSLTVDEDEHRYSVRLSIPANGNQNCDN